jgi:hypothetical protein
MKDYIVRAPQTDRLAVPVPTKLSELEDDLPAPPYDTRLNVLCQGTLSSDPTAATNFGAGVAGVGFNSGFANPIADLGGPVLVTFPATGLYLITARCYWTSTTSTAPIVGRIVAFANRVMQNTVATANLVFSGSAGRDNKLGQLTVGVDGSETLLFVTASVLLFVPAGTSFSPTYSAAVNPGGGIATVLDFWIVRTA